MLDAKYGFTRTLTGVSYDAARRRIEAALSGRVQAHGFDVRGMRAPAEAVGKA